jgi:hypothetical protein
MTSALFPNLAPGFSGVHAGFGPGRTPDVEEYVPEEEDLPQPAVWGAAALPLLTGQREEAQAPAPTLAQLQVPVDIGVPDSAAIPVRRPRARGWIELSGTESAPIPAPPGQYHLARAPGRLC